MGSISRFKMCDWYKVQETKGTRSRFKMCDWYKVQETMGNRSWFKKCHSFNDKLPILPKKTVQQKQYFKHWKTFANACVIF